MSEELNQETWANDGYSKTNMRIAQMIQILHFPVEES